MNFNYFETPGYKFLPISIRKYLLECYNYDHNSADPSKIVSLQLLFHSFGRTVFITERQVDKISEKIQNEL